MRYDYWVVRFVPDAIREEFVNIAVIAGYENDWAMRHVSDLRRASRLGGSATMAKPMLDRIERQISAELDVVGSFVPQSKNEVFSRGQVEDLRVRLNNIVQLSDARPVMARSADEAASMAFELMIVDQGYEHKPRSRTRVVRELADAFQMHPELVQRVAQSQTATVGRQAARFDFVLNAQEDASVVQLSQVWGFDLKQAENLQKNIRSWNYMVGLVREDGAAISDRKGRRRPRHVRIPQDVQINAVYTVPNSARTRDELEIALEGWRRLEIEPVPADEYERVVEQAESLI